MLASEWQAALRATLAFWDGQWVVLSPDVDGVLSMALLQAIMHRERGVKPGLLATYDGGTLVMLASIEAQASSRLLASALWLDLDVCNGCLCIGQHVVQRSEADEIPGRHGNSFNPNVWWGVSVERYTRKYPLATAHLLVPLLFPGAAGIADIGAATPAGRALRALLACLAVADSALANRIKFRPNVDRWLTRLVGAGPSIVRAATELHLTEAALPFSEFKEHLWDALHLHVTWARWTDAQAGIGPVAPADVAHLVTRILSATAAAWGDAPPATPPRLRSPLAPDAVIGLSEWRSSRGVLDAMPQGLPAWLRGEAVFSYAFTSTAIVNVTTHSGVLQRMLPRPALRRET
jgi:hypothetical protein